jgi:hypothetical protein
VKLSGNLPSTSTPATQQGPRRVATAAPRPGCAPTALAEPGHQTYPAPRVWPPISSMHCSMPALESSSEKLEFGNWTDEPSGPQTF